MAHDWPWSTPDWVKAGLSDYSPMAAIECYVTSNQTLDLWVTRGHPIMIFGPYIYELVGWVLNRRAIKSSLV